MRAQITKPDGFRCAPQGHTTVTLPIGTIVEGEPARWALEAGAGVKIGPAYDAKVVQPAERKARAPRKRKAQNDKPDGTA